MKRIHYLGALLVILAGLAAIQAQENISGGGAIGNLWDTNGNLEIKTVATTSAVDYVTATNGASANPATVALGVDGSDSNINLNLVSKGSGTVQCNGSACGGGLGDPGANGIVVRTALNTTTRFAITTSGRGGFWGIVEMYPLASAYTAAATANRVYVYQFVLHGQYKAAKIIFYVQTLYAGGLADFGIYDAALTTLLLHTGAQSTTSTGAFSVTLGSPVTLGPGVFSLAWGTDNTTALFQGLTTTAGNFLGMENKNTQHTGYCANALSSGSLPATCGAVSANNVVAAAVKFEP